MIHTFDLIHININVNSVYQVKLFSHANLMIFWTSMINSIVCYGILYIILEGPDEIMIKMPIQFIECLEPGL